MEDKKQQNMPCSTQATLATDSPAAQKLSAEEEQKETERIKREKECKELSIRFSLPTRMGEWVEDTRLTEEKCKEYEKKRAACLTFYQKQTLVIEHLFASAQIAKHEDVLKYDIPIQLQSDVTIIVPDDSPKLVLQLSLLITDLLMETHNVVKLNTDCPVTVAYDKLRLRRNVFICVSITGKPPRSPVLYGEDFYLRLADTDGGPELYLSGAVPTFDNFGESKGRIPVVLTETPDRYAKFRIVDPIPENMISLQGAAVPTFGRVTIAHTLTNQLLAVELIETITTSFAFDHPVDICTYRDSQHRITSENFWKFVTQAIDEGAGDTENPEINSSVEGDGQPGPSTTE